MADYDRLDNAIAIMAKTFNVDVEDLRKVFSAIIEVMTDAQLTMEDINKLLETPGMKKELGKNVLQVAEQVVIILRKAAEVEPVEN